MDVKMLWAGWGVADRKHETNVELLVVTLSSWLLRFSLPALGLVLTSKQTRKALMNGDRRLAECSKGRRETCCWSH